MTMVEQSLLYNRRRNDGEVVVTGVDNQIDFIGEYKWSKNHNNHALLGVGIGVMEDENISVNRV